MIFHRLNDFSSVGMIFHRLDDFYGVSSGLFIDWVG